VKNTPKMLREMIEHTRNGFQESHWIEYAKIRGQQVYRNYPQLKPTGRTPYLIVCTSYSGCGKTSFGDRLAEEHGFSVVDSDRVRSETLRGGKNSPAQEAKVTKSISELRDHYLRNGHDVIIATCSVNDLYREVFLSTDEKIHRRMLLYFRSDRTLLKERRGDDSLEFMDLLWEEPDISAPYLCGVKYLEITSQRPEDIDRNVKLVIEKLKIGRR
jgi:gluconate kinase